ncbi:MAG: squalene/phytoene synthase family protein [Deltaproteobacteria bacterium]|nr:squalene/phytoene synthase family protein [Deltaproteobacteria bacterium]
MRPPPADLLTTILKRVSRSFFLSLAILPRRLRSPMGLAYLLARAADTIADTRLVPRADRRKYLELLRGELRGDAGGRVREIAEALTGAQQNPAERELLARLEECLALFRGLDEGDRDRVRRLLLTLTQGMLMDLEIFPGEDEGRLAALETRMDLDRYTYFVAGCVGEFWTDMHLAHRPALAGWETETMRARGVRFGQGLQMTNVLRDLARDLRIGRCYLPRDELSALGTTPEALLEPAAITKVRPLLRDLLALTLRHYDEGWAYTLAVPRREWRLRLACAWPLLIGLRTLALVARADNLLDPGVTVKISRPAVYAIVLRSAALAWSNTALGAHAGRLRRRIPT